MTDFRKTFSIKFHENPPNSPNCSMPTGRHRGRPAGRRTDGQIDMTKLMFPFRNFANTPKNCQVDR